MPHIHIINKKKLERKVRANASFPHKTALKAFSQYNFEKNLLLYI